MDKTDNSITNYNHGISVIERKNIIVTGVKKIDNFDNEEFLMETTMGYLIVKGEELYESKNPFNDQYHYRYKW